MVKIINIKSGQPFDIYIGRANKYYLQHVDSIFHNPFVIGKHGDRKEVIEKFKHYAENNKEILDNLHLIDDKTLACYCNWPAEDCHGSILIELRDKQKIKNTCKCIIAGSRNINDYDLVEQAIKESGFKIDEVVCGEANGVDRIGKLIAANNNIKIKSFPANWEDLTETPQKLKTNKFGRTYNILAGFNRNERMASYSSHLICIHNYSNGSLNMIKLAKENNLIIYEKIVK